ncbi:GGDEF domain-containing phosphodiesterase [Pontixanthobacter aestiaquae]|uniref:EAL domain-containing protein n=1 Tax=Pontixanthobacter aestiaquae TaxID=1509367 RepID=A0A844Z8K4_9SPHN|nr:GGDEF domain-containing phosphodiesterase [Pontixanthobacter aestiaquae]MDN3645596.1 GGDEF domain-containing phosphodiesterase [Pontixanthobacter aestiaquae]MXO83407.1 EAL domain-containing protein [Pontixanthobacter aestiaquae]
MGSAARNLETDMQDDLTGLAGMAAARETLATWQHDAAGRGETAPVHAMLLSLGRFDAVNLAYGETVGDSALVTVAQRILHFAEDEFEEGEWLVARLGGGKFLLAAHEACSRERWQWLAEALADAVAHPISGLSSTGTLRLWPRVALMRPAPGEGPAMIFDRLAETIEEARSKQGSRVLWADGGLTVPGRRSAIVDADLLAALDRDEIEVLYQPQVSLADDSIIGAEALARWQHPELGRIGAGQLFAIAERTDHVAQLSRNIAKQALTAAASWPATLRLSINVTPADLASTSFADDLTSLVEECGCDPERLTLEITEHVLLNNLEQTAKTLLALKAHGVRIAIDDFGAGFCNFRYLKILPLDAIKLDRAMIDGIASDERDLAVLRGIIAMAKALKLGVIAEGVETEDQRAIIEREGCDFYQGFLRATPVSNDEFLTLAAD